jgi:nitrogen PTS system EIIA component
MTMNFILRPEAIGIVRASSKATILGELADRFASVYGLDRDMVCDRLQEREALGSTGFGRGVAIPHARVAGLKRPVAAFLRIGGPVDFDAADGHPVDIVFGLLSPESAGVAHLHALAAISRMMRDEGVHEALSAAGDPEALFGLLVNVTDRFAA